MADEDAAGGEHLLDHAQAEREAEVEPDHVADDLGREAVAGVAGAGGRRHPARLSVLTPSRKPAGSNLTVPAPLPTLRRDPRGARRTARGRCGSLLLHRGGLAPPTPCRSPGALLLANAPRGSGTSGSPRAALFPPALGRIRPTSG